MLLIGLSNEVAKRTHSPGTFIKRFQASPLHHGCHCYLMLIDQEYLDKLLAFNSFNNGFFIFFFKYIDESHVTYDQKTAAIEAME